MSNSSFGDLLKKHTYPHKCNGILHIHAVQGFGRNQKKTKREIFQFRTKMMIRFHALVGVSRFAK